MAVINVATREIHAKVVYYGPGFSGKTTNLEYIYRRVPKESKGEMLSLATETERTLFFDFLHLDVAQVRGFTVRFHLYTTPGQQLYERTRFAVLNGADGVVFVGDAERERLKDNVDSLKELAQNLTKQGKNFRAFPLIMQYNKIDLPSALPVPVLDKYLNPMKVPRYESVAIRGQGVFETLRGICRLVTNTL
jgi:signal recognition particle receptor subunit beta